MEVIKEVEVIVEKIVYVQESEIDKKKEGNNIFEDVNTDMKIHTSEENIQESREDKKQNASEEIEKEDNTFKVHTGLVPIEADPAESALDAIQSEQITNEPTSQV